MYPHEFPGALWYDQEEVDAVSKVISNKSPFRYYGVKCDKEVFNFEKELGEYLSTSSLSNNNQHNNCLLYTSPSPRDRTRSRMPSSA